MIVFLWTEPSGASGPILRTPLDKLWEDFMMKGAPANVYFDGKGLVDRTKPGEKLASFEEAHGDPLLAAWMTNRGIAVQNLQETRLLGFWRLGGWELLGGLLAQANRPSDLVELYGKLALRKEPYFPVPHRSAPEQRWSYEFFVVRRDRGTGRAELIRKRIFEPPQVVQGPYPDRPVAVEFKYDPISRRARLSVSGLARPFQEEFEVSRVRR